MTPDLFTIPDFVIQELVPPETYAELGEKAWGLFDKRILIALSTIRQKNGVAVTVNNWHLGGPFRYRGWRPKDCPVGAPLSAHKDGKAIDCGIAGKTPEESRQWIRDNHNEPGINLITRIERGVNWLHIDCMPTVGARGIVEFER